MTASSAVHLRRRVPRRPGAGRAHLRRTRDRRTRPRVAVWRDPARASTRTTSSSRSPASYTTSPTRSRPTTTPTTTDAAPTLVRPLFGDRVARLVGMHVVAKRYLVTTRAARIERRSAIAASRRSPSRATRCRERRSTRCRRIPDFEAMLALRRADDRAKDPQRTRPRASEYVARRPRAVRPRGRLSRVSGRGRRSSRRRCGIAMRRHSRWWPRRVRASAP